MSAYVSVELQRQVRSQFANCCAYCRTLESLTVSTFEFEHIIPRSAGGQATFDNLALACPTCNRYKSNRQSAPDPISNEIVSLYHPHLQMWSDHFTWNDDTTEIVGLSKVGRATIALLRMNRPQMIRVRRMWVAMDEHPPPLD